MSITKQSNALNGLLAKRISDLTEVIWLLFGTTFKANSGSPILVLTINSSEQKRLRMSSYESSLRASLGNLSDEEISKKLKTGYFSDEALVVAVQVLNERGFASDEAKAKEKIVLGESENKTSNYLTSVQNNNFVKGNVLVWMVSLFLFGVSSYTKNRDIPAVLLIQGLFYSVIGTIVHLIYIKLKKKTWTLEELRKKYNSNFKVALVVIGIAFISTLVRIYFNVATFIAWVDLVVLSIIFVMYIKSVKVAKHALAIYSLIPALIGISLGLDGNIMIWAFGFLVAAQSILINNVINSKTIDAFQGSSFEHVGFNQSGNDSYTLSSQHQNIQTSQVKSEPPKVYSSTLSPIEESIWEQVANEYESTSRRTGLHAKLFAENNGDETKIKIAYLKQRVLEISNNKANTESKTQVTGIESSLSNLQLIKQKKFSLGKVSGIECLLLQNGKGVVLTNARDYRIYANEKKMTMAAANFKKTGEYLEEGFIEFIKREEIFN
jgi:hypothetical protein